MSVIAVVKPLNDLDAILNEASELCHEGEFSKAISLYDKILKTNPDNLDANIDKGVALQNMGKFRQALKCFQKACTLSPENVTAILKDRKSTRLNSSH